ncbi:splicing factor U2af large subunit B-like isoform X2 [Cynara cardunculus var. scolymus]|uniref:splicing factor U2af large subunit B-like isoform X2 n=1 Tax=Cynara cardunculus var. scolymus TaxID=59895 RepID=UPI000D62CAD1|nr:splicing factor U2af large subunit B-like isoform X2 [Cynara cardunculus var. scolymus]
MSSRHDNRHPDGDGGGGSSPYDVFEDRDSQIQKHKGREDNDRSKTRERDRDRGKDRDRRHRDYPERSGRDERGRERNDDDGRSRNRDYSRRHDYDRDRERHHRHRSRSASPDRSRESSRSRSKSKRTSGFDMAPPTAATLPGAVGQLPDAPQSMPGMFQNMFPFGTAQLGALPLMPAQAMTQQATRHARRVYVGGLPPLANEQTIATFFSHIMTAIGGNSAGPGDAVVNVYINHEKKFAFVEMRTVEEASNAMALDGIIFEGVSVRVRRPTDYNPSLAATLGPSQPNPNLNLAAAGLTPGGIGGAEGPDRIFVGGLPYYFTEVQIRELLESFGPLRGFDLVKDRDTGNSKGYGFCVYEDQAATDVACAALNGLKMGDKTLTVRRATISSGQMKTEQETILAQAQQHIAMQKMALQVGGFNLPGVGMPRAPDEVPTKVLCLTEVISADELMDDGEYEEILEDMREEGRKFGDLTNVVIPRPDPNGEQIPGLGKVFLEYAESSDCAKAKDSLGGRKFGGNVVTAVYYPEDKYLQGDYGA